MTTTSEWQARWDSVMLGNYGTPALAITSGSGMVAIDADGFEYLDFLGGIAVNVLGHAHPAIAAAVAKQAEELQHVSNLAIHPRGVELAERLVALTGWNASVFFAQDGATANEAALKIARRYGYTRSSDGSKQRIVAMDGSFHGRTMGALAVTGNAAKREPFAPFGHTVSFVPFGDLAALAAAMESDVAAIVVEPIQGENGVVVPPLGFLAGVRELASKFDALMIVDEVQSGVGRTGEWFVTTAAGVVPDVMTLAKGLAGGLPLGAVIATGPARDAFRPGDHGTTFGGNPVSCAAALAVIDTIEHQGLLANALRMGESMRTGIAAIASPRIREVRGAGLWIGVQLTDAIAAPLEVKLRAAGFLVNAAKPDVLRLAPPLIVTAEQVARFLAALDRALKDFA
jgi:acetylornithine/N-succinyldiaminopimelate aminotransferase